MTTRTIQFTESSNYEATGTRGCHTYVLPRLLKFCSDLAPRSRILDVGCGNGSVATEFVKRGYSVTGIDLSEPGIRIAKESCPGGNFAVLPADKNVLRNLGEPPFDLVYSLEVIEHLYDPKSFLVGCFAATKAGGRFVCSTPYHGYTKNLLISLADGWDKHANPAFDGGHIKFFSRNTLSSMMEGVGFHSLQFSGAGRVPYLWKSMVMSGEKPLPMGEVDVR